MDKEYQFLWDTVTKLTVNYDFGDAFPVRNTSQVFIDHQQTSFRGIEINESYNLNLYYCHLKFWK